jgi:hypothetical protein
MEEAKELLKSLLRTTVHENTEDLDFCALEKHEKRLCLSNGVFDIDFCAFSGLTEQVLNDAALGKLLSNLSGTFVKYPYCQRLNGYRHQKVLVICDIKPFKLALSLDEPIQEDEQELTQIEAKEVDDNLQQSNFSRNVTELLSFDRGRTFAFRDIREKLISTFCGFEIICFQFGQKQEIENFLAHVEKLDSNTKLGVALGLELFLNDFMLLATPENTSVGECFYPMLLSCKAGSLLCPTKQAAKFVQNSKRYYVLTQGLCATALCTI